jgi:hypothetical protein
MLNEILNKVKTLYEGSDVTINITITSSAVQTALVIATLAVAFGYVMIQGGMGYTILMALLGAMRVVMFIHRVVKNDDDEGDTNGGDSDCECDDE